MWILIEARKRDLFHIHTSRMVKRAGQSTIPLTNTPPAGTYSTSLIFILAGVNRLSLGTDPVGFLIFPAFDRHSSALTPFEFRPVDRARFLPIHLFITSNLTQAKVVVLL